MHPPVDRGNVMVTLCWAAKGGSGTTVVASALAIASTRPSLIVDLAGEVPAVLGVAEPDRPGVDDWLTSSAPPMRLEQLLVPVGPRRWLLPWRARSTGEPADGGRWDELGHWLCAWADLEPGAVIIDAGTGEPPAPLVAHARSVLLVTRPCYLALRRAARCDTRPSGVVLVDEPGHTLRTRDVEHAVGAPVTATITYDPAVSRAVDAGLLQARLPRDIVRELRDVA
jgi:hypothetical protein